ncbi:MAG: hypothetical protein JO215_10180 [Ktedonobacteraceae bacterium]|nr:hypothetical protein [Ktedonobacteraceae bacterium]
MGMLAFLFVLFIVVLVVCGILVNTYLYANDAFNEERIRRRRGKPPLSAASFSQTATIPTPAAAADLYYGGIGVQNEDNASILIRRFILYSIGILVTLVIMTLLVLGATQF